VCLAGAPNGRHFLREQLQEVRNVDAFMNARVQQQKPMEWPSDGQALYSSEPVPHMDVSDKFTKSIVNATSTRTNNTITGSVCADEEAFTELGA